MASFDILDALVFPDDPTPTSPGFFPPSGSVDQATTTASSSAAAHDDYPTFASQHDPWAAYPTGDYGDYDGGLYGGGMMGLDLGGTSVGGPSGSSTGGGGIELMDIGQSRPSSARPFVFPLVYARQMGPRREASSCLRKTRFVGDCCEVDGVDCAVELCSPPFRSPRPLALAWLAPPSDLQTPVSPVRECAPCRT